MRPAFAHIARLARALRAWLGLVMLAGLAGCMSKAPGAGPPARVALVIGNAAYENARPLNNPVNDAQDMCRALRDLGFVALCRTNVATRAEFGSLVDDYVSRLGPSTVGVVYYAGHGVQVNGANFLVPTKGQPAGSGASPVSALFGLDELFERLRERPSRLNIIMLDACRTELFEEGGRSGAGRATASPSASASAGSTLVRALQALPRSASGLATIQGEAPPNTKVLYATASKAAAFDGEGRNGPLTKHILRHIATRDQPLETFFNRVTGDVETETLRELAKRQSPFTYGSFAGKFCFNGCPGDAPPPPPAH